MSVNDLYARWPVLGRAVFRTHRAVFRATGGRVGGRLVGREVVLLTTTGRRTGRSRTWPLLALRIDGGLLLVASDGGRPTNPGWWWNLTSDPWVEVEGRGWHASMLASTLLEEERARVWPRVVAAYPGYAGYQRRTVRAIPVVSLTPASTVPGSRA